MNRVRCAAGTAGLLALMVVIGCFRPCLAESFEVRFRVFDEQGAELKVGQINHRMTHGRPARLSAGTVNLQTLALTGLNQNYGNGGKWTMPFSGGGQGMMVHWNTASTGYSTFLLTNGGAGFTRADTVIFNQRLAEDAKRQLDSVVSVNPSFTPSPRLARLRYQIDACFVRLRASVRPRDKGRTGQHCLDRVAAAMTMYLRELGIQRAAALGGAARWGVTITPEPSRPLLFDLRKVDDLVALFAPEHRWARIEMVGDGSDDLPRIKAIVDYASAHGVKTMGQLFDSAYQADVSLDLFKQRVDQMLHYEGMAQVTAWEIGNEVNGGWLGESVPEKIEYAASSVKSLWPDKETVLTFFWTSIQDETDSSLFNWINTRVTDSMLRSIDSIALSIYVDDQPLGFSWPLVMNRLGALFQGKTIMTGELDFNPDGAYREGEQRASADAATRSFIKHRYASAFATPGSAGGGFWWYFSPKMTGRTYQWRALRAIYCEAYHCR